MKFDKRLSKLESLRRGRADRCSECPGLVVVHDDGPAPVCPGCGKRPGIVIRQVVVNSREELQKLQGMGR